MRTLLAVSTLALLSAARPQGDEPPPKPYQVGWPIRDELVLQDLSHEDHSLFDEHEDDVLVLVFWSLRDPTCRLYEKRLTALQESFAQKHVTVLLVDSNYDELTHPTKDPIDDIKKLVEDTKLKLPILLDPGNQRADDFKALCANQAFVIDHLRYLRYSGGIDDDPQGKMDPKTVSHWLEDAVSAVVDGRDPEQPLTRPKGRRIVRAPKQG